MRVHPSICVLLCLFVVHRSSAFDHFGLGFPFTNINHEFLTIPESDESTDDSWPFGVRGVLSRNNPEAVLPTQLGSDEAVHIPGRDTEPLDLDFVKGPITDPDSPGIEVINVPAKPTSAAEYDGEAHFPDSLFNHHFGSFLGHNFFSSFPGIGFFDFPRYTPWWKGPNVCKIREEDIEEDGEANEGDKASGEVEVKENKSDSLIQAFHLNVESCVEKSNKYQCKKIHNQGGKKSTYIITYKCCSGFGRRRSQDNPNGQCVKLDLAPIENTIETLGAKKFMETAKNSLSSDEMDGMTVFAPMDDSFSEFSERMYEDNLVVVPLNKRERRQVNEGTGNEQNSNTRDLVHAHMVKGIIDIEDIENEQLLYSEFNNSTIRMNIFPKPPSANEQEYPYQYTANCVPIIKPNQLASNGMVHVVKNIITPPEKTVMEMLKERSDMAVLVTVLERTQLDKLLMDNSKHMTVFAPTDQAFDKLEPHLRKKLKEGRGCATNILRNHILDLTFCSSAVANNAKTSAFNLLSEKLEMEVSEETNRRDGNEIADMNNEQDIMVNGVARVMEADLMGTNGVIHVLDTMLPTESAMPITSTLTEHNSTIMNKLLEAGNLADYVDDSMNMTLFAPTDKAFEQSEAGKRWIRMLEENPNQLKDNQELKNFIDYHMSQPMIKTCDLNDGMIKSRADRDLRVNLYSTNFPFMNVMNRATVNCARLVHFDEDSCGSVVHQIDKVLEAPENNLLQQLEANEKYSTFLSLIREMNLTSLLEDSTKEYTLLVPSDELFKETDDYLTELRDSKGQLEYLIKSHIIPEVVCCAGITQSQWPFIRSIETLSQAYLQLNRDRRPKVQNAGITKCDIMATNGIIHEINDLISVSNRQQHTQQQPQHDQLTFRHNFFF